MDQLNQTDTEGTWAAVGPRRYPRFKYETDIRIYPRDCPVVRGHSVDISRSGISVMTREEVPLDEMVRVEFTLPLGNVELLAMVRQKTAFRYGLHFVEASSAVDVVGRTCRELALEQSPASL